MTGEQLIEEGRRLQRPCFLLRPVVCIYAMLGGWHFPGQDDDWAELVDEQLMVLTFRDSEPWVEGWRMRSGDFKVIQRIT
jgi:hypothetical protein